MLVVGDEILSGRTKDRNIGTITEHLTAIGIALSEVRIVGDVAEDIVAAVNALQARYTYVLHDGRHRADARRHHGRQHRRRLRVAIDIDPRGRWR